MFVTNQHILLQFDHIYEPGPSQGSETPLLNEQNKESNKRRTIIFEANGMVQSQVGEVEEYLKSPIVGESELIDGTKIIITKYDNTQSKKQDLVILQFDRSGNASILKTITDYFTIIQNSLTDPRYDIIPTLDDDSKIKLEAENREI